MKTREEICEKQDTVCEAEAGDSTVLAEKRPGQSGTCGGNGEFSLAGGELRHAYRAHAVEGLLPTYVEDRLRSTKTNSSNCSDTAAQKGKQARMCTSNKEQHMHCVAAFL
jgi:hypothetical protein